MRISTDASPWGIKGILYDKYWHPFSFFYEKTSAADISRFGIVPGKSEHMPVLVQGATGICAAGGAKNGWPHVSCGNRQPRAHLHSRETQIGQPVVGQIAAELALDMAEQLYKPMRISHPPGVTNTLPDVLSRLGAPGARVQEWRESMAKATYVQIVRNTSY